MLTIESATKTKQIKALIGDIAKEIKTTKCVTFCRFSNAKSFNDAKDFISKAGFEVTESIGLNFQVW